MRKGWEYKKIGSLCNISTGKLDANAANENGLYPFFTCSKTPLSINSYAYDCECVLIAGNGDLNVKYYNGKFNAYQRTYILQLKNNSFNVNMRYIYAFFNLYIEELRRKSIGGIIKYIKLGDLTNAILPFPPLSTQLAIVSELDKINELIRLKKEQLKDFDNLAQSLFYEMFGDPVENEKGWEVKKLREIGEVKTGNTPSRSNDNFYNEKFIEWIKTDNIRNEQMNPTTAAEYLSKEGAECGRIVGKGSILVACIAGSLSSIGKCCITTKNVAFNQQINAITPYGDFCNSIYLYELIRNSSKYIQQNATTGMKHILSKSIFEKMNFPLPPLPLQHLFAQRIEQIEREKSEVQKSIQDLETLLASRMQYWFE